MAVVEYASRWNVTFYILLHTNAYTIKSMSKKVKLSL
jgi:hypothetical protein